MTPFAAQGKCSAEHKFLRVFKLYLAFGRNAFLEMLAYRLRYYAGWITYLLFVSVHYFIWSAVYASHPEGSAIKGFTLDEMITYVAVGWVARSLYFSYADSDIDELVRSGQVGLYLLRPVDFHLVVLAKSAGESLFRLLFFSLPIGSVILLLFPISPPVSWACFFMFLAATFFSFLIMVELSFAVGLTSFYLKSIEGVIRAKYFLVQLLSGLLLPLSFFPSWCRIFLENLPFQSIAYVPLKIYLGKLEGAAAVREIGAQFLWFAALYILGQVLWRSAVRRLSIQGG